MNQQYRSSARAKEIVESLKPVAEKDAGKRFLGLYNLLLDSGRAQEHRGTSWGSTILEKDWKE